MCGQSNKETRQQLRLKVKNFQAIMVNIYWLVDWSENFVRLCLIRFQFCNFFNKQNVAWPTSFLSLINIKEFMLRVHTSFFPVHHEE